MLIPFRSVLNQINQLLLLAFLFDFVIDNERISEYINIAFLISMFLESIFLTSDKSLVKAGKLIYPKNISDMHISKIKLILFCASIGALAYHIYDNSWQEINSWVNIVLPVYFAFYFKEINGLRLGLDYVQINGINPKVLKWKDIQSFQVDRGLIVINSNKKVLKARGVHPQAIIEIQEFLFKHKLNHVKAIV